MLSACFSYDEKCVKFARALLHHVRSNPAEPREARAEMMMAPGARARAVTEGALCARNRKKIIPSRPPPPLSIVTLAPQRFRASRSRVVFTLTGNFFDVNGL